MSSTKNLLHVNPDDLNLAPRAVDRNGACRLLGIGLTELAERTATGEIPSLKVGRRRLYRVAALDTWLAGQETGGDAA